MGKCIKNYLFVLEYIFISDLFFESKIFFLEFDICMLLKWYNFYMFYVKDVFGLFIKTFNFFVGWIFEGFVGREKDVFYFFSR